jgi:hypothetical protein
MGNFSSKKLFVEKKMLVRQESCDDEFHWTDLCKEHSGEDVVHMCFLESTIRPLVPMANGNQMQIIDNLLNMDTISLECNQDTCTALGAGLMSRLYLESSKLCLVVESRSKIIEIEAFVETFNYFKFDFKSYNSSDDFYDHEPAIQAAKVLLITKKLYDRIVEHKKKLLDQFKYFVFVDQQFKGFAEANRQKNFYQAFQNRSKLILLKMVEPSGN